LCFGGQNAKERRFEFDPFIRRNKYLIRRFVIGGEEEEKV
jgi:hypothetical protein